MKEIYYWNATMNSETPIDNIDVFKYFDNLLVGKDRWSWMETGSDYNASETGVYTTYGANLGQPIEYYNDYDLKIRYVYDGSPFAKAGITRGWTLKAINGTDVMTLIKNDTFYSTYNNPNNSFTFTDLEGNTVTKDITATQINTRSVITSKVFTNADYSSLPHSVGYMLYNTFNENMTSDISDAMSKFSAAGIKDLILDLRYNGGGNSKACDFLAGYIAPKSSDGKILVKREHNSKYSNWDDKKESTSYISRKTDALNLNRLYVISGKGTASASEIIINGLAPFMEIIQVGDTTYGKPNGMYVFAYPEKNYTNADYIFLPICFYSVNSLGKGNYEDGIIPTNYRPDDLYHNFGTTEDLIKGCLYHITFGKFPDLPTKSKATDNGKKYRINMEEQSRNYGRYTSLPPY